MRRLLLLLTLLAAGSCSITNEEIIGHYYMKHNSQSRIDINQDHTFQLYSAELNPFLHPFEHPDRYFFTTKGSWTRYTNTLALTSDSTAQYMPQVQILDSSKVSHPGTQVVFIDYKNDTIPILSVDVGDSLIIAQLHGTIPALKYNPEDYEPYSPFYKNINNIDSLEFKFYGYPPVSFAFDQLKGHKYRFQLNPITYPTYFRQKPIVIKKNKLVDKEYKFKFLKSKTDL